MIVQAAPAAAGHAGTARCIASAVRQVVHRARARSPRRARRRAGTGRRSRGSRCSRGRSRSGPAAIRSSGAIADRAVLPGAVLDAAAPDVEVEVERVVPEREQQERRRRRARARPAGASGSGGRRARGGAARAAADAPASRRASRGGSLTVVTSASRARRSADHQRADPLGGAGAVVERARRAGRGRARRSRSQISSSSSRSVEITSAATPPPASSRIALAHGVRRADVEAVGRLVEDDDLGVERQLAREQHLLDVAARERAGARRDARRAHVELAHELARLAVDLAALDPPERQNGRWPMRLRTRLRPTPQRADDALAEAVVGDVAQAELLARARRRACRSARRRAARRPAVARRWPATTSASARWPLPSTPATPRISPCAQLERDVLDARARAPTPAAVTPLELEHDVVARARRHAARRARRARPAARRRRRRRAASSPNMMRTISARSSSCVRRAQSRSGSSVPTTRPWRRIETRSPSASASCSLWVMKTTARPCPLSRARPSRARRSPAA